MEALFEKGSLLGQVAIIIPSYNAGEYLGRAVESALSQSFQDIEIIVVDDGSTDGSAELLATIKDSRFQLIRQDNAGKSVAMNRAIGMARGDFYCILDADDEIHPDRVAIQVKALEENPDVAAVFCGHDLLVGSRRIAPRMRAKGRAACRSDIDAMRMPAHDPTGMYRMRMVRDLIYEPGLRIGQGFDYILQVGERWPMLVLGECLYSYRIGNVSATTARVDAREAAVRTVIARACERRNVPIEEGRILGSPARSRNRIADNGVATHCLESVVDLRADGAWAQGLHVGVWCAALHPLDWQYYRALGAAVMPAQLLRKLRSVRGRTADG